MSSQEEEVRCVCGTDNKSNYIQCDECLCWQHQECMNLKEIPASNYYCEECKPEGHPYYELFRKKQNEPKHKRSTLNSRYAEQDLEFLKIIEESKLTARGINTTVTRTDDTAQGQHQSDQENQQEQEPQPQKQQPQQKISKSPKKSPNKKKKKKPLKFVDLHRRVKIMIDYLESLPELMIDEPENELEWEGKDNFIPSGPIDLVAGQVHSALIRFQQKWDQY